jgi:hypothetical protein
MRLRLLALLPIALVAVAPGGAPAAKPKSFHCGATSVTVLFWPHGHPAISGVNFPKIKTPHLEVYRPDPRYLGGNFLLYVDAKGIVDPSKSYCGTGPRIPSGAIANARTISTKRAVTCTASAVQSADVTKSKTGVTVRGRVSSTTLWIARLRKKGASKITFDSSACQAAPSPS